MGNTKSLLAVDLGLRSGLALYSENGKLRWYRSHNFGSRDRLRRGVYSILREIDDLACVILEGDAALARAWIKEAKRRNIDAQLINAETWRASLLRERNQRSGTAAKQSADALARKIIDSSGLARPTSLRHDAAEAILIGMWAILELGWLDDLPTGWAALQT